MSERKSTDDAIDQLLREALRDDLPAGLQQDLRSSLHTAWRTLSAERRAAAQRTEGSGSLWNWRTGGLPQPVLAAAALVVLATGAALQMAGAPRALADSLSANQTAAQVERALRRVASMTCRIQTRDPEGRLRQYLVEWTASGGARVQVDVGGARVERRVQTPAPSVSVLDGRSRGAAAAGRAVNDPLVQTVEAWLSPWRVARTLAGTWQHATGGTMFAGTEAFLVSPVDSRAPFTVTIDSRTRLPLRVGEAVFGWDWATPEVNDAKRD